MSKSKPSLGDPPCPPPESPRRRPYSVVVYVRTLFARRCRYTSRATHVDVSHERRTPSFPSCPPPSPFPSPRPTLPASFVCSCRISSPRPPAAPTPRTRTRLGSYPEKGKKKDEKKNAIDPSLSPPLRAVSIMKRSEIGVYSPLPPPLRPPAHPSDPLALFRNDVNPIVKTTGWMADHR